MDAAKLPHLPEILAATDLKYRCLFKGKAEVDWGHVAPWLVQLSQASTFTAKLFTEGDGSHHFWGLGAAGYLRSPLGFDALWASLRKFTRLRDEDGKWYYCRFWDGSIFLSAKHPLVYEFFLGCGPASMVIVPEVSARSVRMFRLAEIDGNSEGPARPIVPKIMTQELIAALDQATEHERDRRDMDELQRRLLPTMLDDALRAHLCDVLSRLRETGFSETAIRQDAVLYYAKAMKRSLQTDALTILTRRETGPKIRLWQVQRLLEGMP